MRSANRTNANNTYNVNASGYINNNNANNANCALPDRVFRACQVCAQRGYGEEKRKGLKSGPQGRIKRRDTVDACIGTVVHAEICYFLLKEGDTVDEDNVTSFDSLWDAAKKCSHGVMWKDSAAYFVLNRIHEVSKLSVQLQNGTYRQRTPTYFTVTHPKRREIASLSFRDRVYQRSLYDNAVYPQIVPHLIYDNGACLTNKGTDFTRNRLKCFLQKYYRKHGADGYIVHADVKGYFPNMPHEAVLKCFRKLLAPDTYERVKDILSVFPGDSGYPPGSPMVQMAGVALLNDLDHVIKDRLRMKYYIRYMDDMIVIVQDRSQAIYILDVIAKELEKVGLRLNTEKTRVVSLRSGELFLGFRFRLTETGKVLMLTDPVRVKAERRKLCRMAILVSKGTMKEEKRRACYESWRAHASKGTNRALILKMDRDFYHNTED